MATFSSLLYWSQICIFRCQISTSSVCHSRFYKHLTNMENKIEIWCDKIYFIQYQSIFIVQYHLQSAFVGFPVTFVVSVAGKSNTYGSVDVKISRCFSKNCNSNNGHFRFTSNDEIIASGKAGESFHDIRYSMSSPCFRAASGRIIK